MKRAWVSLALATALCGCVSSLDVQRFDPNVPQIGYPYRLRLTQYQVTATWRVVSCDSAAATPLKIKTTAEIKETTALDPEQFYVIDPRSLQGLFRTTEFTMEWYEDRTPKSITADVDDQTGVAIGNVLEGVSKLAAAGLGLPAGPGSSKCTTEVTDALAAINGKPGDKRNPGQKAVTDAAQKAVDGQIARVTTLNANATAMGTTIDDHTRRTLGQARARLEALLAVLALEQSKLKDLNDVLTDTRTTTWPDIGSELESTTPLKPSSAARKRWNLEDSKAVMLFMRLTPLDQTAAPPAVADAAPTPIKPPGDWPAADARPAPAQPKDDWPAAGDPHPVPATQLAAVPLREQVAANPPPVLKPAPLAAAPPAPREQTASTADRRRPSPKPPGLPYREPSRVQLDICLGDPCAGASEDLEARGSLIASNKGLALQAGTMMYLPFRAQTFAHIKNSAGFAQSGVLTSAGTSQLRGAGSGATEAFKGTSTQVGATVDAARAADTKRLTAAADEAKARKALADAQGALTSQPTPDDVAKIAAFQAEATLATAEKTRNDALAALAASKAAAGQ